MSKENQRQGEDFVVGAADQSGVQAWVNAIREPRTLFAVIALNLSALPIAFLLLHLTWLLVNDLLNPVGPEEPLALALIRIASSFESALLFFYVSWLSLRNFKARKTQRAERSEQGSAPRV